MNKKTAKLLLLTALTLCLVLCFTMGASAKTITQPLDFTDSAAPASGSGFTWDKTKKVLTLDDFNMDVESAEYGIILPDGSTIEFSGDNAVTVEGYDADNTDCCAILCCGSLTLVSGGDENDILDLKAGDNTGDGSVSAALLCQDPNGTATCDLTVESGIITALTGSASSSYGVYVDGDVIVENGILSAESGSAVGAYSTSEGLYCGGNISLGECTLEAFSDAAGDDKGERGTSYGVVCAGSMNLENTTMTAVAGPADEAYALYCVDAINMQGGDLDLQSEYGTGKNYALYCNDTLKIKHGLITMVGDLSACGFDIYETFKGNKEWGMLSNASFKEAQDSVFITSAEDLADIHSRTDLVQRQEKVPMKIYYPMDNPFEDVLPTDYFVDSVAWGSSLGIVAGYEEEGKKLFKPNEPCTRAHIVCFLWRAAGEPFDAGNENPFEDVKEGSYYYDAVQWAYHAGVVAGIDDTHFCPDDTCTRAQAVSFLYRFAGKPHGTVSSNPFVDNQDKNAYYFSAVLWAMDKGITAGVDDTHFAPNDKCTRAQIVCFLDRYINPSGKKDAVNNDNIENTENTENN